MTTLNLSAVPMQEGTVARLNPKAGFGYVRDQSGANEYIFIFGFALKHSQAKNLSVGKVVHFQVSGQGRVDKLLLDERVQTES